MNIVVTGSSRGIGKAIVQEFCRRDNHKIMAVSRSREELEWLRKANPSQVIPVACDLSDEKQLYKQMREAIQQFKQVDILINNAGQLINKPFENMTSDEFLNIFKVNFFGIVSLIQILQPLMGKSTLSHIVNISSIGGLQNSVKFSGLSAYCATKAALINLTECLAVEFKEKNIHVNALALGAVQTTMLEQAFPNYKTKMTPESMASYIVDFATTAHHYCNGKVFPISLSTP